MGLVLAKVSCFAWQDTAGIMSIIIALVSGLVLLYAIIGKEEGDDEDFEQPLMRLSCGAYSAAYWAYIVYYLLIV